MNPWPRFWQATESLPGPEATLLEWRLSVGDDVDLSRFPLRPTDRRACSLPTSLNRCRPRHSVVRHRNGEYEAVDPQTGRAVAISSDDILIYRLDLTAVLKQLSVVIPLQRSPGTHAEVPDLRRVGEYSPFAGYVFPAFFTVCCDPDEFQRSLEALAAREKQFLIIAPTRQFVEPSVVKILERASACFLPLTESVSIESSGVWKLTPFAATQLRSFCEMVIPEIEHDDGRIFFKTPPNAKWSDLQINFRDRETVTAKIGNVSRVLMYTEMGMADGRNKRPTKQWELLYSFAEAYGHLTWGSPAATRQNQKRREDLARNLSDFFRIDGAPIIYDRDSKGWKTVFGIEA